MHARFQATATGGCSVFAQILRPVDGGRQTVRATQPPHRNHPRYRVVTRRAKSVRRDEDPPPRTLYVGEEEFVAD